MRCACVGNQQTLERNGSHTCGDADFRKTCSGLLIFSRAVHIFKLIKYCLCLEYPTSIMKWKWRFGPLGDMSYLLCIALDITSTKCEVRVSCVCQRFLSWFVMSVKDHMQGFQERGQGSFTYCRDTECEKVLKSNAGCSWYESFGTSPLLRSPLVL